MKQPLVSVIVVSYNHSKYIRENLDSIKAQTYPNIELIVADDASKDNSVEVFEAWFSENNIEAKKNYHKQNTGLATTLNECIEMASGEYIKPIAADDFLHPESIEKCMQEFSKNDNLGFVFSDTYFVDKYSNIFESDLFGRKLYSLPYEELKEELMNRCFICAPTTLISHKALKDTGKYNPSKIVEDYDRWLRIITSGYELRCIPEKLAYYRSHGENISGNNNGRMAEEVFILNFKYSTRNLLLNKDIERNYLHFNYKFGKEFFDAYRNYRYKDTFTYFLIKYNLSSLLKIYRIIKQKLNIKN